MSVDGQRLFFALWPDAPALERLADLAASVALETGGRATPADNIHMTLEFLGDVASADVPRLFEIGAGLRAGTFRLRLDRLGGFRRAKVAWAGAHTAPAELVHLQQALATSLAAAGHKLEERPFAPHVTLARKVARAPRARGIEPIEWEIPELTLVRSHAGTYTRIATWGLGR